MILRGRLLIDARSEPRLGWVRIDGDRIAELGDGPPPERADAGGDACLICPGFYDAHVHLPQFESIGCESDDLIGWLQRVIYPAETRWSQPAFATRALGESLDRLVTAGTVGFAGYLTSHPHAIAAMQAGHARRPLRAIVGQSRMDRRGPDDLIRQPVAVRPAPQPRLAFSVNPRFAVSCSPELLQQCGDEATSDAIIQTHIAEQVSECELIRSLFPAHPHYAAVYDAFDLLTPRTLLAHAVHLSSEEWSLVAERGCVVVHCPTANTFLRSGLFDLHAARDHAVPLALGSDVAAGPDVAMPRVARAMIEVAKVRAMTGHATTPVPTPAEAWTMITLGNAEHLGFAGGGRLAEDASADLLVLRLPFEIDEDLIGRLLYTWRDDYIERRVLAGKLQ
ncbi:MAG: amidohydrolase family protein [Phycisphaerales bacterium]|nr:amidohydrolase family protein [Phycisphaerae bacterium]NNF43992.1 amidohydrolase family protein [Phycisphaerales bacterium]NNM27796.1 amidohydrolase family protein [Phycisphaerales bacterium]